MDSPIHHAKYLDQLVVCSIEANALLDAAWLARRELDWRKAVGTARYSSISDRSLHAIIDACWRTFPLPDAADTRDRAIDSEIAREEERRDGR